MRIILIILHEYVLSIPHDFQKCNDGARSSGLLLQNHGDCLIDSNLQEIHSILAEHAYLLLSTQQSFATTRCQAGDPEKTCPSGLC